MLTTRARHRFRELATLATALGILLASAPADAQTPRPPAPAAPAAPAPIERLGGDRVRVGNVMVDMAAREIRVEGVVNEVNILEFIAVPKGGFKAYESALELDTNAINFNLGLILIGLDSSRATHPKQHLDPDPPSGDPVDVLIEWDDNGSPRRIRAEEMVYNDVTKQTLPEGPWVYTGSVFSAANGAYLADTEGSLIGFVHSPAPVIDSPRPLSPGVYGSSRINPALGLSPGTKVQVIVRALPRN
ncbi:MAG: YdjY domain-containing protein [Vicinamibacterales bacterium]